MNNKKFGTLMYFLVKNASINSFTKFLEYIGLTMEDYKEIKQYLEKTYGIKMYI